MVINKIEFNTGSLRNVPGWFITIVVVTILLYTWLQQVHWEWRNSKQEKQFQVSEIVRSRWGESRGGPVWSSPWSQNSWLHPRKWLSCLPRTLIITSPHISSIHHPLPRPSQLTEHCPTHILSSPPSWMWAQAQAECVLNRRAVG